jgi:RNA polymerase sigma-B factor
MLRLRFEKDLTQREIAGQFGISQMHVSRLLRRSIKYLRERAVETEGVTGQAA